MVVQDFKAYTERFYQVGYKISCLVVSDGNNPFGLILQILGFTSAILNDFNTANGISSGLAFPNLTTSMNSLGTSLNAVPSFNGASPATIAGVIGPLQNAQSAVSANLANVSQRLFGT